MKGRSARRGAARLLSGRNEWGVVGRRLTAELLKVVPRGVEGTPHANAVGKHEIHEPGQSIGAQGRDADLPADRLTRLYC
jgi:hypothetical protein